MKDRYIELTESWALLTIVYIVVSLSFFGMVGKHITADVNVSACSFAAFASMVAWACIKSLLTIGE